MAKWKQISSRTGSKGFTLIELLIVVAIIAILAAIAVPNFLEAQTRAKVSRAYSDMRSVATGIEAYAVDNNKYPPLTVAPVGNIMFYAPYQLTSPISYLTAGVLSDVFKGQKQPDAEERDAFAGENNTIDFFRRFEYFNGDEWKRLSAGNTWLVFNQVSGTFESYIARDENSQGKWYLGSYGPDLKAGPELPTRTGANALILYDPTNGTVSKGDVVRSQKDSKGQGVQGS